MHKLEVYYKNYKSVKNLPKTQNNDKKRELFLSESNRLFDIAICKCFDYKRCNCTIRIPSREHEFLQDQRTERKMVIGWVDVKTSKRIQRSMERKATELEKQKKSIGKREKFRIP